MANFRKSGLGKGLGALIPSEVGTENQSEYRIISVSSIKPNPKQPRRHFDEESLAGLAASIAEVGILQPILVSEVENGEYELVAGERRWRAARRAGLLNIPALVRQLDDLRRFENTIVENLHREDLDPLEEAEAYSRLIEEYSYTHEMIAQRIGKSRAAVSNSLRLLQLSFGVQNAIRMGHISAGHARALLSVSDRSLQEELSKKIISEGLSVREIEHIVKGLDTEQTEQIEDGLGTDTGLESEGNARESRLSNSLTRPPGLFELEKLLADKLNTTVKVQLNGKKGRVMIDFATLEDLERIYRLMFSRSD